MGIKHSRTPFERPSDGRRSSEAHLGVCPLLALHVDVVIDDLDLRERRLDGTFAGPATRNQHLLLRDVVAEAAAASSTARQWVCGLPYHISDNSYAYTSAPAIHRLARAVVGCGFRTDIAFRHPTESLCPLSTVDQRSAA